jgi:hypothetical protein
LVQDGRTKKLSYIRITESISGENELKVREVKISLKNHTYKWLKNTILTAVRPIAGLNRTSIASKLKLYGILYLLINM